MRTILVILFIITGLQGFTQDTTITKRRHRHSEVYLGLGVDNNKYEGLNQCLKYYNLPGNFNANAFSFSYGLLRGYKRINRELMVAFSGQKFITDSKKFTDQNLVAQFLLHYKIKRQGWLQASVYSGISISTLYLNIDSIYKPNGIGIFNSISGVKPFLNIPVGVAIKHYFKFKDNKDKDQPTGWFMGLRGAYHFCIYQDDWTFGRVNSLVYQINQPNYFEVSLLLGLYHK